MSALVQQLAQCDHERVLKPVVDIYTDREQKAQKSSKLLLRESRELLIKITEIYFQTTLCVDALDEIDPDRRIHLLKSLKYVVEKSKNLVKIFITSRNDPDILTQLGSFPRIDIQPDDQASDISNFIKSRIGRIIADKELLRGNVGDKLQLEIREVLVTRSQGM